MEEYTNEEELQDLKSNQTNTKIVKTGAKAAANYFAPGVGGKAVDIASKTKVGDALLNIGGQILTEATKNSPLGEGMQNVLNKADDLGAIDLADKALDASSSSPDNLNALDSLTDNIDTPDLSSSKPKPKKQNNIMLYLFLVPFIVIILIVIMMLPDTMLSLTDGSGSYNQASAYVSPNVLSNEQIENSLIYLGDSRVSSLNTSLNKNQITYISDANKGYDWFIETGKNELLAYTSANIQKFVVINLGLSDLSNIDQYINAYNILINNYDKVKVYFMSVNPIDEELASQNEYFITNQDIEAFNQKLLSAFSSRYIDVYTEIKDDFETIDGINYLDITNQKIHQITIDYIKKHNNISLLEEYPNVSETKKLINTSLISALGLDGITFLDEFINSQINIGGKCTGAGVAGAATGLIYGLHQKGYHLPYYYGGGHNYQGGIDNNWGTNIGASIPTEKGTIFYYSGLDCSGFVAWSMNTAGVSGGTTASNYSGYGTTITYEEASPGDLLVIPDHVIMVIENKKTYLQTAESTPSGVQFSTMNKSKIENSNYKIIDMDNYYHNNCKI